MTRGVRQIVRFNWPFYAAALCSIALTIPLVRNVPGGDPVHRVFYAGAGLAVFWIAASLAASWLVYDRSKLTTWRWIPAALGIVPRTWINIHAGLDESTPALRRLFPDATGRVFDIFEAAQMTEPSIARARRLARNEVVPEQVDFRRLPAERGSVDAALLLLSAHELRTEASRRALFDELHRVLAPHGRVVVAEHLRDWSNFAAFGPGFLHFHSRRAWRRSFTGSDFAVAAEFPITPFVRVFVLTRRDAYDDRLRHPSAALADRRPRDGVAGGGEPVGADSLQVA